MSDPFSTDSPGAADDDADVVFRNVPAGALLRVRASHVRATGTTATDILAHC
ncbi:spike base protein, RCAP_Rcc01079 family [Sphingomonas lenta]|uniref:spike base protein, RCAP_Rcc01079 family n=1 Tax=Sphingomonas lenta TaxID=1141887 RepID=UPI001595FFFD|nr:hypothetical protein [Sphingomonas lenta]